ncbi:MAG: hypothetical protein NVSMB31_09310 [Vulcanimicrobiaceae bacterium]
MARMNSVEVREGTAADRPFVEDLGKRTVLSSVSAMRQSNLPMINVGFERLLLFVYDQAHELFIAVRDGKPAGFVLVLQSLPDEVTLMPQAFIAYMAVEPDARRKGVAAALLQAAEDAARRFGLPHMALMVTEENTAARKLYEAAGYTTERRLLCKTL